MIYFGERGTPSDSRCFGGDSIFSKLVGTVVGTEKAG